MDRPRLKAQLIPRVVPPDKVFLLAESGHYLVHGAAATAIVGLLDGTHTVPEIAEAVADRFTLGDVLFAVSKFQRFGHLAEGTTRAQDPGLTALFDSQGLDPAAAVAALGHAAVEVITAGRVTQTAPVSTALTRMGCSVTTRTAAQVLEGDTDQNAVAVVLTDDYLRPELHKLDVALHGADRPWLLVKPAGAEVWIGPRFVPGQTGCWTCLEERLDGNRQVERYLIRELGDEPGRVAASVSTAPYITDLAAALTAAAVTELLTTGISGYDGVLVSVHTASLTTERHRLIRQPQCATCGDPALLRKPPRIDLDPSGTVKFSDDGGYRVMPPKDTYLRLEKHVSRLLGAVSSLRLLNEMDNGVAYSYSAGHNFALAGHNIAMLRRNLRGQSGGKGRTDIQARVSGMCEAIERYSGVWREARPTRRAAYQDLDDQTAVHPNDVLLYSQAQYDMRHQWNEKDAGRLHAIPEPFQPDRPIAWTSVWSLSNQRERLVPAGYCWFGHPDLREHFYCFSDGNGNASGNTLEEAILQGFCELCERDSVALWWYNRLRHPRFDLDSLHDPYVDMLREFYEGMNRDIWVLDLTTDLGVPTFAALSRRLDHPVEDVLMGFGAHLDPRMAVSRALTELNQFLPAIINRLPDGSTDYWEDDQATLDWWRHATIASEPWLLPSSATARTLADHRPVPSGTNIAALVTACVDRAAAAGLEVLALDQSRPDIELKVAKVIVPGLRHFWRRLGPGRLYDVPVALGWLPAPVPEAGLNPLSVFF